MTRVSEHGGSSTVVTYPESFRSRTGRRRSLQRAINDGRVWCEGTYVVAAPVEHSGTLNAGVFTVVCDPRSSLVVRR